MEIRKPEIDYSTNSTGRSFGKNPVVVLREPPRALQTGFFPPSGSPSWNSVLRRTAPGVTSPPPPAAHISPTENECANCPISYFSWSFQPPYGSPGGQTPRFHKKTDRRNPHPHDLSQNFVPGALPATPGRHKRVQDDLVFAHFHKPLYWPVFSKGFRFFFKKPFLKDIFLGCWHRFHCRISGPFPARDLSVGELILG